MKQKEGGTIQRSPLIQIWLTTGLSHAAAAAAAVAAGRHLPTYPPNRSALTFISYCYNYAACRVQYMLDISILRKSPTIYYYYYWTIFHFGRSAKIVPPSKEVRGQRAVRVVVVVLVATLCVRIIHFLVCTRVCMTAQPKSRQGNVKVVVVVIVEFVLVKTYTYFYMGLVCLCTSYMRTQDTLSCLK